MHHICHINYYSYSQYESPWGILWACMLSLELTNSTYEKTVFEAMREVASLYCYASPNFYLLDFLSPCDLRCICFMAGKLHHLSSNYFLLLLVSSWDQVPSNKDIIIWRGTFPIIIKVTNNLGIAFVFKKQSIHYLVYFFFIYQSMHVKVTNNFDLIFDVNPSQLASK